MRTAVIGIDGQSAAIASQGLVEVAHLLQGGPHAAVDVRVVGFQFQQLGDTSGSRLRNVPWS